MIALLTKIKGQHLLIIGLLGFSAWAWGEIRFQKSESNRKGDNFNSLRDMDSLKVANLTFRTNQEIEGYIESNEELNELIEEQDIKIRKLNSIIYQKQQYIDNISRSTDVSELVEDIRNNVESKSTWKDSTDCLVIKGNVLYKKDSLYVNVNEREFKNKIAITGFWERDQRNLWTRWFGRKIAKAKATSKCGESETIKIEKKKK